MSTDYSEILKSLGTDLDEMKAKQSEGKEQAKANDKAWDVQIKKVEKLMKGIKSIYGGEQETTASKPAKPPSATSAEVLETAVQVLADSQPKSMPFGKLKTETQKILKQKGRGLTGVFRNFDRLLAGAESIVETEAGIYSLASSGLGAVA